MTMDSETLQLILDWGISILLFFALWAILLFVVKRISEKKRSKETALDGFEKEEKDPPVTPTGV